MAITEVTAPTEREVEESFNRINVFLWASLHCSLAYLFISSRKYLANDTQMWGLLLQMGVWLASCGDRGPGGWPHTA